MVRILASLGLWINSRAIYSETTFYCSWAKKNKTYPPEKNNSQLKIGPEMTQKEMTSFNHPFSGALAASFREGNHSLGTFLFG